MSGGGSTAKALLKEARDKLDAGNPDAALALCKKVLSADRGNYNAYVLVGFCSARKQDTTRALQAYDRAIALKPSQPVAWKGIVDALRDVPSIESGGSSDLLLRRARAQLKLLNLNPSASPGKQTSFQDAAETLLSIAGGDVSLVPEAIAALKSRPAGSPLPGGAEHVASLVANLCFSALDICKGTSLDYDEAASVTWETGELAEALDFLEAVLGPGGMNSVDVNARKLVVRRILWRVRCRKRGVSGAIVDLRRLGAYEDIQAFFEEDTIDGLDDVEDQERLLCAAKAFHLFPTLKHLPRSGAAAATLLWQGLGKNEDLDRAELLLDDAAGSSAASAKSRLTRVSGDKEPRNAESAGISGISNPTHAFVRARFHLARNQYKACIGVASHGLALCKELGNRSRLATLLHLLRAEAFLGDGRGADAVKEFRLALEWCSSVERQPFVLDSIELSCRRGLIRAVTSDSGRQSEESIAEIHHAASSAHKDSATLGRLEELWSEAVCIGQSGIANIATTLEALVEQAADRVREWKRLAWRSTWELEVLGEAICGSPQQTAAIAYMRLAQVYCEMEATEANLKRAKELLMKSANLVGSAPGPYALLGRAFEQEALLYGDDGIASAKAMNRALRCYRKCTELDAAHPVAARRLVHLLSSRPDFVSKIVAPRDAERISVALNVTEKNPRARWAWNVVGWYQLREGNEYEACFAFQSALKGRPEVPPSAVHDIFFGTGVGEFASCFSETNVAVDIDSWRGLALVYKGLGKHGAALSCLNSALELIPSAGKFEGSPTFDKSVSVLQVERASILCLLGSFEEGLTTLEPQASVSQGLASELATGDCTSNYNILGLSTEVDRLTTVGDTYLSLGQEAWESGWFQRAFKLRGKSVTCYKRALDECKRAAPHLSPCASFKNVGDSLRECVSDRSPTVCRLLPENDIRTALESATVAYGHALHFAPWRSRVGAAHDLGTTLAAKVRFSLDANTALTNLAFKLLASDGVATEGVMGQFLLGQCQAQNTATSKKYRAAAEKLLKLEVERSEQAQRKLFAATSLVELYDGENCRVDASNWALTALRLDATSWQAWYATGLAREIDGAANGWPLESAKSTVDAYAEADKLGGGGPMVAAKLAAAGERYAVSMKQSGVAIEAVAREAAASVAESVRAGGEGTPVCAALLEEASKHRRDQLLVQLQGCERKEMNAARLAHLCPYCSSAQELIGSSGKVLVT